MDFFLGSGTTVAVAHKMNRRYIGIEQMNDTMDHIILNRMKKVIDGEDGGVSNICEWHGGGSFVYCELMKWNEIFIDKVQNATTTDELKTIWEDMKSKAFLSYRVKVSEVDKNMKDFEELSLENQKNFLIEVLDKNHLYVPLSEIDDVIYGVTEKDKELNKQFYNL